MFESNGITATFHPKFEKKSGKKIKAGMYLYVIFKRTKNKVFQCMRTNGMCEKLTVGFLGGMEKG